MEYVIYPFAILGFVFGISAISQVTFLKNEMEQLKKELNSLKSK